MATLLVLLAAAPLAPWLTRLSPVRNAIAARFSQESHLQVGFGGLSMGWLSPVAVRGITIRTAEGELVAEIDELRTVKNLWSLATGPDKGLIRFQRPRITMQLNDRDSNLQQALNSLRKADLRSGLLGLIFHPDRDLHALLEIREASLVTPQSPIAADIETQVEIERRVGELTLQVAPGRILDRARVTPELCDFGLQYIAPILANATDASGVVSLEFDVFRIPVAHLETAELSGRLHIETIQTEMQSPLLKRVAVALARLLNRPDPERIHLADNSLVEFTTRQGRIHHEGLSFGLPKLSEELTITTDGSVGFDRTLDIKIHIPLPFELLGDAPLLQRLGGHTLHLSVVGTLEEPQIKLPSDGSFVSGLLGELAGGDEETTQSIRKLVSELRESAAAGIEELRQRDQQQPAEEASEGDDSDAQEKTKGKLKQKLGRGVGKLLDKLKKTEAPSSQPEAN